MKSGLGNATTVFVANGGGAGQKAPHFMIHIIPRRSDDGLFEIPKRKATEPELEKVKSILIEKIKERLGREPVPVNKHEDLDKNKNIPEPSDSEKEPEIVCRLEQNQ